MGEGQWEEQETKRAEKLDLGGAMGRDGFRALNVWQKSKNLAVRVYRISNIGSLSKDFGLRDQIRGSAVSIPSNIAEGDERDTDKDSVRFFYMSKGSLAELRTQLLIAHEIGYLDLALYEDLDKECISIGKMLGKLIKSRSVLAYGP
jgi:four helix bundle protein